MSYLTHIYGIQKNGTEEPIYRAGTERYKHKEQTCEHSGGRKGWEKLRDQHQLTFTNFSKYADNYFHYSSHVFPCSHISSLMNIYLVPSFHILASLVAQRLKHLPAMWETWVQSLGQEDPLEKEMATHSSILAWRIPWMEEPGGLESTGSQRVRHD